MSESSASVIGSGSGAGSSSAKVRYMLGFLLYAVLMGGAMSMVVVTLMPQHIKEAGISNPDAAFGLISGIGSIWSMVITIFIGAMSDRTRSKRGRRIPWMAAGAVVSAISYYLIGVPTTTAGICIAYLVACFGLNMMGAPMVARLSDTVPENARGSVSAAFGGGIVIGQGVGTMIGANFLTGTSTGFLVAAIMFLMAGVLGVVIPPMDGSNLDQEKSDTSVLQAVGHAFTPPTRGASDFWKAFACRTLLLLSYQMVSAYQLYILQDYVKLDTSSVMAVVAQMSMITMVVSLVASFVVGPISDKIGRRKAPVCLACALFALGIAMPWVFRSAMGMLLFAGVAGFGYGVYSAVDQALNVDVLPNKEDAGKDLGFLNIATCAGQALGSAATSFIVSSTGSYLTVFPVAIVMAVVSAAFVLSIRGVK